MNDRNVPGGMLVLLVLVGLGGGLVLGAEFSERSAIRRMQIEAVKAGVGKWGADENGNVRFSWVTPSAK